KPNLPNGSTSEVVSSNFTVPASAVTGNVRMRVILSKDTAPAACGEVDAGEVEDYTINITGSSAANRVALLELQASAIGRSSLLEWVSNEGPLAERFVLERSADGQQYEDLQIVDQMEPMSNAHHTYVWTDELPLAGDNHYRIRLELRDGRISYSNVQQLHFGELTALSIFPNPATHRTQLNLTRYLHQSVELQIVDLKGRVLQQIHLAKAPATPVEIDVSTLQNGMYLIFVQPEQGRTTSMKLMVQRLY
ncbi:MAG: GEVED domain-containing protein, partial [Bacteroidota bacterium]